MNTHPQLTIFLCLLILSGCSAVPTVEPNTSPQLQIIHAAYKRAINNLEQDSSYIWHHGRLGNSVVNLQGPPHIGLCYHWQELVHNSIRGAIKRTGWKSSGIAINEGNFLEHHAVLVYDPTHLKLADILQSNNKSKSYVLDPWGSGEPRIYTVGQWLQLAASIEVQPRLTEIAPGILSKNP